MTNLTKEQLTRKANIEHCRRELLVAQGNLRGEILLCKDHIYTQVGSSVVCEICVQYFGWWCPNSADGLCEYDSVEDPVHDFCIYCGNPEERK
jgi:hypothetical protein